MKKYINIIQVYGDKKKCLHSELKKVKSEIIELKQNNE